MAEDTSAELTSLTVQLLSAYLSNNSVASGELAGLITTTRGALANTRTAEPMATRENGAASQTHVAPAQEAVPSGQSGKAPSPAKSALGPPTLIEAVLASNGYAARSSSHAPQAKDEPTAAEQRAVSKAA